MTQTSNLNPIYGFQTIMETLKILLVDFSFYQNYIYARNMLQECFCFLQTQNALYIQWRKGGHMGSKLWNRIMTIYCKYAGNIASWMFLGFRQTRNAIYIWNGGGGHMGSYLWNGMIAIYSSGLVESLQFRVGVQPLFPHILFFRLLLKVEITF